MFQNDLTLRDAITANLKERIAESKPIADRVQAKFPKSFHPTGLSPKELTGRNYLSHEDKLATVQESVFKKGVKAIQDSQVTRSIILRDTDELKDIIKKATGKNRSLIGTVELSKLVQLITSKPDASTPPVYARYKAEADAEEMLKKVEESLEDEAGAESTKSGTTPKQNDTDKLVQRLVNLQMDPATPPEAPVQYSADRGEKDKTQTGILQTFQLRPGASDVTSYHDFNCLQIAFEHVWTKIFDGQIASLGRELYHEYVQLKQFTDDKTPDLTISTLDDLRQLMDEVKNLSSRVQQNTPTDLQPGVDDSANNVPASTSDTIETIKTALDPARAVTKAIGNKTVETIVNPGGAFVDALVTLFAGKSQLRWESFPGPLPLGNDVITVSFEENAAKPGEVEIVLKNLEDAWWWKGLEFWEYDVSGKVISNFKISNDPRDNDVWDKSSYNVLSLYTPQVKNALLEFKKQNTIFGDRTGFYVLKGLNEKLKDRTRVTFTWEKD